MPRYGRDFDRWGGTGRQEQERGYRAGGRGGYGFDRGPEDWGRGRGGYAGEGGWTGGGPTGGMGGYGGPGFDRAMRGGGYGMAYGGRDMGYGGRNDFGGGRGLSESNIGERGGRHGSGGRVRAAEIMTENPEAVTPDTTLSEVAQRMRDLDVGIIPVVDDTTTRRLHGVITDRDIAIRAVAEGKDGRSKVSECMTTDVETVNKNDSIRDVLDLMEREQVRRVPVTDREGRLVGIIAQADLAVEYAGDRPRRERMVQNTVERISEPARPQRGGSGGRSAMQNRQGGSGRTEAISASGSNAQGRSAGAQRTGTQSAEDQGTGTRS